MFDFDSAIAQCEEIVADTLGSGATITTLLGIVITDLNVMVKTVDQVMGEEGGWSGRYAGNLGSASAETHFIEVPTTITNELEKSRCVMANGDSYKIMDHVGVNVGFNVFAAIKE